MHSQHKKKFDDLAENIRDIVGNRTMYFLPNVGNWGDSLIREGAERFLGHYGFKYKRLREEADLSRNFFKRPSNIQNILLRKPSSSVLVFNGSGAFCNFYSREQLIVRLSRKFAKVIVLPSTFQYSVKFPENVTVFVRDRFQSQTNMAHAAFCHDMAFFLNLEREEPTADHGCFLRTDAEAVESETKADSRDLSAMGDHLKPIEMLVKEIGRFRTIDTDRLHIGIAATLLGREVNFYPNNYFKIEAIYRSSIDGFFPKTTFYSSRDALSQLEHNESDNAETEV